MIRRLAEDQLDLSFGGVPAILVQIDQGAPIRMLSPVMTDGAGLVMSNALPVRTWAEFLDYARQSRDEPLRIGYKAALSVQNLLFEQLLAEAGISYAKSSAAADVQIQLVNLSGARHLVPALRHGLVDGFVSMQPLPGACRGRWARETGYVAERHDGYSSRSRLSLLCDRGADRGARCAW